MRWLKVLEAARHANCGRRDIYNAVKAGRLRAARVIRIGGSVRVPVDDLRAWIARQVAERIEAGR